MRRIIFGIILVGIAVSAVAQMLWQPSAESDALFAAGVDLYNVGKYREAIPLFAKSDSLDKAQIDPSSNRRDYSSMWFASCYYKMGDTATAASINANYRFAPVDRRLTVKSDSLSQIGMEYANQGDYAKAVEYLTQCAEIEKSVLGENHIFYGNTLNLISLCDYYQGYYGDAILFGEETLNIIEKTFGKKNPEYVTTLVNLANYNYYSNKYSQAIQLGTEALELIEQIFGKESPDYAMSLNDLANYNYSMGHYMDAVRLSTKALDIMKTSNGSNNPEYATILNTLANCYYGLGNYTDAIEFSTEALNIRETTLGMEHPDYALSLNNMADYYASSGNYAESIRLATEALNIRENVFGKNHPEYAMSLNNLAHYYGLIGDYSEAIRLGTEALELIEKLLGNNNQYYAASLSNLSTYNTYLGNYAEAIRLEDKALNIRKQVLGKEHIDYAASLNNLASYNYYLGNCSEAIGLCTEALRIERNVLGESHPDYATTLNNLAEYNASVGNYAEAIRLATEALDIRAKTLGTNHPDFAMSLNNLANYFSDAGYYAEAVKLGTKALNTIEKSYGKDHPNYATSLNNLAFYNYNSGNYSEAMRLGLETLKIRENLLGMQHPDYATCLADLAAYSFKYGSTDAVGYCVEATEALSGIVKRTFADLTARERNTFWDKYKAWFEGTIHSIAYDMPSDSLTENGYNGALMAKGLLLNSEMELSTLLKESGDEEVANIYNNLKNLRLQINKLYEMPIAERPLDADSLERAAQGLERQLVQRSKVYGDYTANLVIDWKQVRQKLGSGEMAVEFVSFPLRNDSVMYAAYCLRKDMPSPKMVPLFEERQLTSIDKRLYLSSPMLYNLVWKPLEKEMEGVKTVYFAPSGELYNLPIENLPVGEGTYNSGIRGYRRLSSTRQLALRRDSVEVARAAVYGGLKYDTDTVTLANDSRKYRTAEPVQWSSRAVADSLNLRDGVYELPATKIEAEEIDKALETARIQCGNMQTPTIGPHLSCSTA